MKYHTSIHIKHVWKKGVIYFKIRVNNVNIEMYKKYKGSRLERMKENICV
jgi:hypothetical protein